MQHADLSVKAEVSNVTELGGRSQDAIRLAVADEERFGCRRRKYGVPCSSGDASAAGDGLMTVSG